MSELHLTVGSTQPPKVEDKLRLYSMKFCPYAQRARLVLKAKNIPHDIVNINLIDKPEWYFKIHPEGKVPALDTGSEVVVESLDIADFLDEKYPEVPLYPLDPAEKQRDKALIQRISEISSVFAQCVFGSESKTPEVWAQEFTPILNAFDSALASRGSTYFGGSKPGMVDYMLWPWGERAPTLVIKLGQKLPFAADQFPHLKTWRKAMREFPVCNEIFNGPEKFWKVVQYRLKNEKPDYDNV